MAKTHLYNGIKWILLKDDGLSQLYRHPTDPHRRLSVIDPNYTFQPSDADSYMNQYVPAGNYGTATDLYIESFNYGSGANIRSILKFILSSQIPSDSTINSATLSLYYYQQLSSNPTGRTYWAYQVTQPGWVETEVSWNNYKTGSAWATPGADYTTTDGASVVMPASPPAWIAWTVTAQVQTAIDHVDGVAHFLIKDGTEGAAGDYGARFYSREYATDTTKRPKLYVDWSPNITYINVSDTGAGADTVASIVASVPIAETGAGAEALSLAVEVSVSESGAGVENAGVGIDVHEVGMGAEFAWHQKGSVLIDALAIPHVLSIRVLDDATFVDKKLQGGLLPYRKMVGKPGRVVEIVGWSDSQSEIDVLEALVDGTARTFYHPSGDSFAVLVTGFNPDQSVDEYDRRAYRLSLVELRSW